MVGPGIWDPPAKPPAWLDEFDKPLVLVTCSTEFQNDGKLVRAALEALAEEEVNIVVTTAGVDPSSFTPPPNARIERFVPHSPLLERASCVVCHGGMGITQKALSAGVPVCVVPFGRDQFDVARHVEVADAGTRLPASRLRPEEGRSRAHRLGLCPSRWSKSGGRCAGGIATKPRFRPHWADLEADTAKG
jgi:UDP:flavonoid glycosyltransferase YjiC (YdhE family)